jgi:hypothetical protein
MCGYSISLYTLIYASGDTTAQHTQTISFVWKKSIRPHHVCAYVCIWLPICIYGWRPTWVEGLGCKGREKKERKKKDSWRPPRDVVTSSLSGAFPIAETRTNGIFVSTLCVSLFSGEMSPSLFQDFWWGNEYSIWHHQISLAYIYKFRLRTANNCLRHRWNVALNWLWKKNKMQKGP